MVAVAVGVAVVVGVGVVVVVAVAVGVGVVVGVVVVVEVGVEVGVVVEVDMKRAILSQPLITRQQCEADMFDYNRERDNYHETEFDRAIRHSRERPGYAQSYTDLVVRFVCAFVFFLAVFTPIVWGIRYGLQMVGLI